MKLSLHRGSKAFCARGKIHDATTWSGTDERKPAERWTGRAKGRCKKKGQPGSPVACPIAGCQWLDGIYENDARDVSERAERWPRHKRKCNHDIMRGERWPANRDIQGDLADCDGPFSGRGKLTQKAAYDLGRRLRSALPDLIQLGFTTSFARGRISLHREMI